MTSRAGESGGRKPITPKVRLSHDLGWYGSSSTQGGQAWQNNGIPVLAAHQLAVRELIDETSPRQALNFGFGGADEVGAANQLTSSPIKSGSSFIQCDLNTTWNVPGGGHARRCWLKFTALPILDPSVVAERRFVAWTGSVGVENAYGAAGWFNHRRFERLAWADFPGSVVSLMRHWTTQKPLKDDDLAFVAGGNVRPSQALADYSHFNDRGQRMIFEEWQRPCIEAFEGGLPFFPYHRYYFNAPTAQTMGGVVGQLAFVGSLTGCALSLSNPDGGPNPDFAIDSGALLTRASATPVKAGITDLLVVVRRGEVVRKCRIQVTIGSLTTQPQIMTLDGHEGLCLWSNDNSGTFDAPSYPAATALQYAGLPQGQTEGSMAFCLHPAASVDGLDAWVYFSFGGHQIRRLTTGAIRVSARDDTGVSFGQLTSGSTAAGGRMTSADGLRWVFYTFSCANDRQRLIVFDDATGATKFDSGNVTLGARPTCALNSLANPSGNARLTWIFGGQSSAFTNTFAGRSGPMWAANREIDFSAPENIALFRTGPASFADLGPAGVVTPVSGPNSGAAVAPYLYLNGHAGDFHEGLNLGTGGPFECWERRDPLGGLPLQGVAVTA